jgi:hypothetical protein
MQSLDAPGFPVILLITGARLRILIFPFILYASHLVNGQTIKHTKMPSSRMIRSVALLRTDVSEDCSASIIRVTKISELGTLAVISNGRTLRRTTITAISSQCTSVAS